MKDSTFLAIAGSVTLIVGLIIGNGWVMIMGSGAMFGSMIERIIEAIKDNKT